MKYLISLTKIIKTQPLFYVIFLFTVNVNAQVSDVTYNFNNNLVPTQWTATINSDSDWVIDTTEFSEGGFSLKSGDITDSQQSGIQWQDDFEAGTIVFDYHYDTEGCCDRLKFYVDNVEILAVGGVNNWEEFRYNIEAGTHTFKWIYKKDGSASTYLDSVWIDNVRFGQLIPESNPLLNTPGAFVFSTQSGFAETQAFNSSVNTKTNQLSQNSMVVIDNNELFFYSNNNLYKYNPTFNSQETIVEGIDIRGFTVVGNSIIASKNNYCGGYLNIFIATGNVFSSNNPCENRWDAIVSNDSTLLTIQSNEIKQRVLTSPSTVVHTEVTSSYLTDLVIDSDGSYWGASGNTIKHYSNSFNLIKEYQLEFNIRTFDIREDGLMATIISYSNNVIYFQPEHNYSKNVIINDIYLYNSSGAFVKGITPDEDSDGLPLWWENTYNLDPTNPADASQDLDNDGRTNIQEYLDKTNPSDPDTDGDGLSDGDENINGTNPLDSDTDDDGLSDGIEVNDLNTNPLSIDTDGDGIDDLTEFLEGLDPTVSNIGLDTDNDNLLDTDEIILGTSPILADSDNDGIDDGEEVNIGTNPLEIDSDDDGLIDGDEIAYNSNPLDQDSDDDGLFDGLEVNIIGSSPINTDSDGDLMPDAWEYENNLNLIVDDSLDDADLDLVNNLDEYLLSGNPNNSDTDNDSISDGDERDLGSALDNSDTDGDRMPDAWELLYGFNLLVADGDLDFDNDGYTNAIEYWNKTNPSDAQDFPLAKMWSTHQANKNHNGYQALDIYNVITEPVVSLNLDEHNNLHPAVLHDENLVYSYSNNLVNYNISQQQETWRKTYNVNPTNPPALSNNSVYIQTGDQGGGTFLRSYDIITGNVNFQSPHGAQWQSYLAPTIAGNYVYINGGTYGGAYSFHKDSGIQQWFSSAFWQFDEWTPAVGEHQVFGYTYGILSVVNRNTGIMEYEISDPSYSWHGYSVGIAPVLGGFDTLIVSNNNFITVFDLLNQDVLWTKVLDFTGQISVSNGVIFSKSQSGTIYALNEINGDTLWTWEPPIRDLVGNIIVTNSHLIVSTSRSTYFVNLVTKDIDYRVDTVGEKVLTNQQKLVITNQNTGEISIYQFEDQELIFSNSFE